MPTPDQNQELFAIADGMIWQRSWGRAADGFLDWDEWRQLPALDTAAVDLALASPALGHLTVFALDVTGKVQYRPYRSPVGWSAWEVLATPGIPRVSAIAAGSYASAYQALFTVAADGTVHCSQCRVDGFGQSAWSPWRDITPLGGLAVLGG